MRTDFDDLIEASIEGTLDSDDEEVSGIPRGEDGRLVRDLLPFSQEHTFERIQLLVESTVASSLTRLQHVDFHIQAWKINTDPALPPSELERPADLRVRYDYDILREDGKVVVEATSRKL